MHVCNTCIVVSWLRKRQCCAAHRAAGEWVEHDDGAVVAASRATGAWREPRVGRLTQRGVEDTRACSTVHMSACHFTVHHTVGSMGSSRSSACQ